MKRLLIAGMVVSCVLTGMVHAGNNREKCSRHNRLIKAQRLIENVNSGRISLESAQKRCGNKLKLVYLSGRVFHFAPHIIPPDAPVDGVLVSIAEFPLSKVMNIQSDVKGDWIMPVIKIRGVPLYLSLKYEKDGFVTTKSNQLTINDEGIDSIAMQFTSEEYYTAAVTQLEQQVSAAIGVPYTVNSLTVATVGKKWASMFFNQFPHGDPGATVTIEPPVSFPTLGPIYFNENVAPDPAQPFVSVDGGVLVTNLPEGKYTLNASKDPYVYKSVTFIIDPEVKLYIASPPHSLQGNNDSGPGEW